MSETTIVPLKKITRFKSTITEVALHIKPEQDDEEKMSLAINGAHFTFYKSEVGTLINALMDTALGEDQ